MSVKLYISHYSTNQSAQVALAKQYIGIATNVAEGLDKDAYQKFLLTKEDEDNRKEISHYLEQYRYRINALYVYILMLDESDVSKVMASAFPPHLKDFPIGEPCTVPPAQVRRAKSGKSYFTDIIKDEMNGAYLSVGVPLYSDDGTILGVVGIDIDAKELEEVSQQVVVNNNVFVFIIDILFAMSLLIVVFLLNKWYKIRFKRDLDQTEKMYISELGKVMDTIKSSRHDMMNHLQVLGGLMDLQLHDKVNDYLKQLTKESKISEMSLRIKNPILMVLFQSKWELSQSKNIQMYFEADQYDYSRVDSMDLAKIYSNLLDNAIEATESYSGDLPQQIHVVCQRVGGKYIFAVENPAQLTAKEQKNLFQYGYTTKENKDALRGNGLMIIKRTVERYMGDIYFQYEKGKVNIRIII
ncbi:sensor histidine kinase regulating citrate/malate metabolism [Paenibacillus sp. DS2015]|uniref:sensor histidine kinase n=1 Tax=Paenibacillus sp. DS2015 TaxID=3373917 RepID=UPI003D1C9CB6